MPGTDKPAPQEQCIVVHECRVSMNQHLQYEYDTTPLPTIMGNIKFHTYSGSLQAQTRPRTPSKRKHHPWPPSHLANAEGSSAGVGGAGLGAKRQGAPAPQRADMYAATVGSTVGTEVGCVPGFSFERWFFFGSWSTAATSFDRAFERRLF